MLQLLYLQGRILQFPLNRRLGEPKSWSGSNGGKREILIAPVRNRILIVLSVA
jgi:hypothetical protein